MGSRMRNLKIFGSATLLFGGSTLCLAYLSDSRAAVHSLVTMPVMLSLDHETAHLLSIWLAKMGLCPRDTRIDNTRLKVAVLISCWLI